MVAAGIPLDRAREFIRNSISQHKEIEKGGGLHVAELQECRILIKELEEVLRILPLDTAEHET